jgi:hypothetical protein
MLWDETQRKLPNGNFLRNKRPLHETQKPMAYVDKTDEQRIERAVKAQASVSLKETFDLELFENPVFKEIEKNKWRTPNGMSYSGQTHAHVNESISPNKTKPPGVINAAMSAYRT